MKRLALLTSAAVLAFSGTAAAYLSKPAARFAAVVAVNEWEASRPWTISSRIGACHRLSDHRINCDAKATGKELRECEEEAPYDCLYLFRTCHLKVRVHEAGYEAIGRVGQVRCRERWGYG